MCSGTQCFSARWVSELLVAFDSNVLTAFLNANSREVPSSGDDLKAFQLFMYSPKLTILPTVAAEAERISAEDKREEHLKWVWYHFSEAQFSHEEQRIADRTQVLLGHHPERGADDCRIVAEAEAAGVTVLATIDKRIKRLQSHTYVQLLSPAGTLEYLGITTGAQPEREPGDGHPLAGASCWHI
jgi:predicted nucleic acid-binding protein